MAKIIDINKNKKQVSTEPKMSKAATQLYNLGKEVDALIVSYLEHDINTFEAAGILSNRAGELLRPLDRKMERLAILVDIIKKQAGMNK